MLNYDFRTYIAEGTEVYGMSTRNLDAQEYQERKASFPSSLLGFLDLDVAALAPLFKKISDELWSLTLTQDERFAQEALSELAELEKRHIYFLHLRLDWTWRISQALALGNFSENLLRRSALLRMAEELKQMQEQIRELFANVLDMDRDQRPVMRKMADYYLRDGESAFRFRAYPLGFELLPSGDFAEVLVPESVYLADLNEEAEAMLFRLVKELAEKEGVTEKLKAEDGMKWVQTMNNIRNRAAEVVYNDLIYN